MTHGYQHRQHGNGMRSRATICGNGGFGVGTKSGHENIDGAACVLSHHRHEHPGVVRHTLRSPNVSLTASCGGMATWISCFLCTSFSRSVMAAR